MGPAERRQKIMSILCRRRYESIQNLANEFSVSSRTIQRDLSVLSTNNPIYTKAGRHDGGVYIVDGFQMQQVYMKEEELAVLIKINRQCQNFLTEDEHQILERMILHYTKPKNGKEIP